MIFPDNSGGREPADSRFSAVRQEQGCQDMTAAKERTGTLLCRELLGLEGTGKDSFIPSDRTEAYYQSRPARRWLDWQRPYWMLIWQSIPAEHKLAEHSGGV